ncbi:MAG: histidine phosphatase family protein [Pseudomonadota bacterium]
MNSSHTLTLPFQLFLLRHGETEWNLKGRIQGQLDSPLMSKGRDQALREGKILSQLRDGLENHQVFCSPFGRAQQTARLALSNEEFLIDERLIEIGCGKWEPTCHEDRFTSDPDLAVQLTEDFATYVNAPAGEGLAELSNRLTELLESLKDPTIIFSHEIALVMRTLLCDSELSSNMAPPRGAILETSQGVACYHS